MQPSEQISTAEDTTETPKANSATGKQQVESCSTQNESMKAPAEAAPEGEQESEPVDELPAGWEVCVSRSSGKPFYYNRDTGQSQYERPVAEQSGEPALVEGQAEDTAVQGGEMPGMTGAEAQSSAVGPGPRSDTGHDNDVAAPASDTQTHTVYSEEDLVAAEEALIDAIESDDPEAIARAEEQWRMIESTQVTGDLPATDHTELGQAGVSSGTTASSVAAAMLFESKQSELYELQQQLLEAPRKEKKALRLKVHWDTQMSELNVDELQAEQLDREVQAAYRSLQVSGYMMKHVHLRCI